MAYSTNLDTCRPENRPFRFLDLPNEIQTKIYEFYYSESSLHLCGYDARTKKLKFEGSPELHLERVCRKVAVEARYIKDICIDKDMTISLHGSLRPSHVGEFCTLERYSWLRHHICNLCLRTRDFIAVPEWKLLVDGCQELATIVIEMSSDCSRFEFKDDMNTEELMYELTIDPGTGKFDITMIDIVEEDLSSLLEMLDTRHTLTTVILRRVDLYVDFDGGHDRPGIELTIKFEVTSNNADVYQWSTSVSARKLAWQDLIIGSARAIPSSSTIAEYAFHQVEPQTRRLPLSSP